MAKKKSQSLLASYRKKNRSNKAVVVLLALLLIIAGIVLIALWATGAIGGSPLPMFASKTPTATATFTPTPVTPTSTATQTITPTETPTITPTPTPDGPYDHIVTEDEYTCYDVAVNFNVKLDVLLYVNGWTECFIRAGDVIKIPAPWQTMPTATVVPTDIYPGTLITYYIESGATLESVAAWYRSTVERILTATNYYRAQNDLALVEDNADLYIGEILIVPVNIATPVPSSTPTRTFTPQP